VSLPGRVESVNLRVDPLDRFIDVDVEQRGRLGVAALRHVVEGHCFGSAEGVTPPVEDGLLGPLGGIAIEQHWPVSRIATEYQVSVTTVRVELHRHGLFVAHRQRHLSDPTAPTYHAK
jgi:hypothetical protein